MKESEKKLQASYDELKKKYMDEKSKVGGYMTSNNNYKRQIAELRLELQKANDYGREADEMLNGRIDEIDEKNRIIAGLQSQVVSLSEKIREKEASVDAMLNASARSKRPWWRRIF